MFELKLQAPRSIRLPLCVRSFNFIFVSNNIWRNCNVYVPAMRVYNILPVNYFVRSALKLIDMCSISSHLGPLQLSLKRILTDIVKFFSIYSLVLFSFACGLNQLMWYFANLERERCYKNSLGEGSDSCSKWKNFGK